MSAYLSVISPSRKLICLALIIAILTLTSSSCKVIRDQVAMRRKIPKEKTISLDGKEVCFIPIIHFGQKEFYRKLKEKVLAYKGLGYTVYYEQTIMRYDQLNISHAAYDTVRRKFRKMTGGRSHTRSDYQQELGTIFKRQQVQPEYDSLGVTASDVNADVTILQMANEYDRLYGAIVLDECDFNTPLADYYSCTCLHNSLLPIIRDFRSRHLAAMLNTALEHKILVLYGGNHIRPVMRILRRQTFE